MQTIMRHTVLTRPVHRVATLLGRRSQDMTIPSAVLFDFSGTLFRLEEDDSWFTGIEVDERAIDGHVQANNAA